MNRKVKRKGNWGKGYPWSLVVPFLLRTGKEPSCVPIPYNCNQETVSETTVPRTRRLLTYPTVPDPGSTSLPVYRIPRSTIGLILMGVPRG